MIRTLATVALAGAVLTACGSSTPPAAPSPSAPSPSAPAPAASGMVMAAPAMTGPTATQAMICGDEIKGEVTQILRLGTPPRTTSSFSQGRFDCVYTLAEGPLRMSVQHSASDAEALAYLQDRRTRIARTEPVAGLTDHAYATGTGVVLLVKDDETLEVDTTGLPEVIGDEGQKRGDLAYEVASDVLGCWTGHDS